MAINQNLYRCQKTRVVNRMELLKRMKKKILESQTLGKHSILKTLKDWTIARKMRALVVRNLVKSAIRSKLREGVLRQMIRSVVGPIKLWTTCSSRARSPKLSGPISSKRTYLLTKMSGSNGQKTSKITSRMLGMKTLLAWLQPIKTKKLPIRNAQRKCGPPTT